MLFGSSTWPSWLAWCPSPLAGSSSPSTWSSPCGVCPSLRMSSTGSRWPHDVGVTNVSSWDKCQASTATVTALVDPMTDQWAVLWTVLGRPHRRDSENLFNALIDARNQKKERMGGTCVNSFTTTIWWNSKTTLYRCASSGTRWRSGEGDAPSTLPC